MTDFATGNVRLLLKNSGMTDQEINCLAFSGELVAMLMELPDTGEIERKHMIYAMQTVQNAILARPIDRALRKAAKS